MEAIYSSGWARVRAPPSPTHTYIHTIKHTHTHTHTCKGEEERRRGAAENGSPRCHAGCAKGDEARPLLAGAIQPHPTATRITSLSPPLPQQPSPPPPRWQTGGRTSFPRLTAGRRGEGNENNEIQRSSVTVCSSRLLTRICIT